jgi:phage/plasmid-like protein (TIGR03299 family)
MEEQRIYVDRTTTWHAIGKDVNECKDMAQVLEKSGLDYTVTKQPVYNFDGVDYAQIPNRFVTTRDNDGHTYDVVSDQFEIIQNRDAFDFVNYIGDDLSFEKAGETANGMIYIIGKLPEVNILGDAFIPHVIFRNGFNGKVKITAAVCPLRLVCQNQFNFAFKNTANTMTIRHVRNAESKLIEARETLRLAADYMQELNTMAERFAGMKISGARAEKVAKYLFPIPEDTRINPMKLKVLTEGREKFKRAIDADDNANFKGTAWGLINAYTDLITHKEPAGKREDRFEGKFINTTFKVSMNPIIDAIEATN